MSMRIIIIPCIVSSLCVGCGDDDPADGKIAPEQIRSSKFAEEYAREKFENLPNHPDLEKLFADFSAISHAHAFMKDDTTKKLYRDIIITTLEMDTQHNVHDAAFATFLLQVTPPEILLEAIVPELGLQGKLHGILDRQTADVRKRLERQSPQGYPGEPDFRHYASYLSNHKGVETSPYLIKHMFRTASGEALHAMMYVQYRLHPYPVSTLSTKTSVDTKIRPVFLAEHVISDVIWHKHFRFDIAPEQLAKAKNELGALSHHKDWWVRLYAAEVMQQHPELRVPDVTERLQKDENELVRETMTRVDVKETNAPDPDIKVQPISPVEM